MKIDACIEKDGRTQRVLEGVADSVGKGVKNIVIVGRSMQDCQFHLMPRLVGVLSDRNLNVERLRCLDVISSDSRIRFISCNLGLSPFKGLRDTEIWLDNAVDPDFEYKLSAHGFLYKDYRDKKIKGMTDEDLAHAFANFPSK